MYKIKEIKEKQIWNNFVIDNDFEFYSFLCSFEWWEVQILNWKKVFRFGIYDSKNNLIWILPLIKNIAKRWTYLFAPHTPLILRNIDFFEVLNSIIDNLKEFAKNENANFIRFNSPIKNTISNKKKFEKLWFINAPMHEHAEDTHLLDLNKTENEILNNMDRKDRYLINRAIKEWVKIDISNSEENIQILTDMHIKHSKKVWYKPFSKDFINSLYKVFKDNITTIKASYNWNVESILMTIKFWKTCVYYIAASDIKSYKFSPNYLCQFEAIKKAKNDWCVIYNFWWVSPDNNPKHPIAWVTKFKRKFWWYDYSLLHAQDLPLNKKYWFNYIIETLRRIKRGYYYKKPE